MRVIRDYAEKEGLKNVTVIEGAAAATNLPAGCCDAIFMRDVYHHITALDAFNKSLLASLKPGGRLAIIDFLPRRGIEVAGGRARQSRRSRHVTSGRRGRDEGGGLHARPYDR